MNESLFLQFNNKLKIKIIDFLIENKGLDFSKKQIIEGTKISRVSLFNVWPQLEEQEVITISRQFGKTKLYILNSKNLI